MAHRALGVGQVDHSRIALERRLIDAGHACFVLDGDNMRHGLNRDLGFSPEEPTREHAARAPRWRAS